MSDVTLDVLILGAGVSGLTAAWLLESQGVDVAVFEARSRVGGRTWSHAMGDARYDLGATWVWDHEDAIQRLLRALDVKTFECRSYADDLHEQGRQIKRARLPHAWAMERRFEGGTQSITEALTRRVSRITLDTPARRIKAADGCLEVTFEDTTRKARHVIAALPPALLGSTIALDGVEDEAMTLLRRTPTWMGDISKVVALYPEPFWRAQGLSGRAFSHTGPMMEIHDLSDPASSDGALFGFVPYGAVKQGDLERRAVEQLVRLFGQHAAHPKTVHIHNWWSDPETAPPTLNTDVHPGLMGHAALRKPLLDGRLHLASTETAAENAGHIDGAVARATQLAAQLIRTISAKP